MQATLLSLLALLTGAGFLNLGLGLQSSLLGLRAQEEAFPLIQTGLFMAAYYAGFVGGSLHCHRLVNRVGHIRTFSALASLASAAALAHAVFVDPLAWTLFRGITGYCFAGLSMVAESWLNQQAENRNRGTLLSFYMVVILLGTALGQILLTVAPVTGYDLFILVSVVISLALVPVALTTSRSPAVIQVSRMSMKRLFVQAPLGLVGCFSSGLVIGAFWSLGAVYADRIGLPTHRIALFMTLLILGGVFFQWPIGRLSDLTDRRWVIAIQSFLLAGAAGVMTNGWVSPGPGLLTLGFTVGGLALPLYALTVAHVNDFLESEDFVPASGILLLIYGSGAMAGPLLASGLMSWHGPGGLFLMAAGVGLGNGSYALWRIHRRAPARDTVTFIPVPRTTQVASGLDPRTAEEQSPVIRIDPEVG